MRFSRRVVFIFLANWMLLLALGAVVRADALEDGAKELAVKVAAQLPQGVPIDLQLENMSSLPERRAQQIRVTLEAELKQRGWQSAGGVAGGFRIVVTLSEDWQRVLLIAQLVLRGKTRIEIVAVPRTAQLSSAARFDFSIERTFLWAQEEPILDATIVREPGDSADGLLVLDQKVISLYGREGDAWKLRSKQSLPAKDSWPRDPRGQIENTGRTMELHLPGLDCDGDAFKALQMSCEAGEPQWKVDGGPAGARGFRLVAHANFFLGGGPGPSLELFSSVDPFFSVTSVEDREGDEIWLFSGVDGRVHLYAEDKGQTGARFQEEATFSGWGSDLAGIYSTCGDHWLVLGTRPGDANTTDGVTGYDVNRTTAVAATPSLEFPGPVTALWSKEESESVVAIVKNLSTRRYEAYLLKVACSN